VGGFRLKWGDEVNAVQFQYGAKAWATMQGKSSGDWRSTATLADGEYITRVEYAVANVSIPGVCQHSCPFFAI
jgi:hypothetical protein